MLAVGTVVMNRLESGKYPNTVCGVVGQKNQFAPGVSVQAMQEGASRQRAERIAQAVLYGKRHRGVGKAMFFHTAGRTYRIRTCITCSLRAATRFMNASRPAPLHPAKRDRTGRTARLHLAGLLRQHLCGVGG